MSTKAEYRCEASSVEGFIQHLAVSYVGRGYVFYVTGVIPDRKDPREIDRKIIAQYGISASKFTRARRKRAGLPNAHYLRHERFFVILSTVGNQAFFSGEGEAVRDARKTPIQYEGYAVGFYSGKPSVRINEGTYLNLKAYFEDIATKRKAETIATQVFNLPFRPYGAIVKQVRAILKRVNEIRQSAGFEPVPKTAVRLWRKPVKTFEGGGETVDSQTESTLRTSSP